jgi:ABC-type transport system involved in multi-copper enzyme maturation permease subunit
MAGVISFTVERILKIKNILFIFLIVLLGLMGMSFGFKEMVSDLTKINLETQKQMTVGLFGVVSFMWLTGIPFLMIITGFGSGLIANEETDGTFLLLVSKPVKRYKIVLGKFIGLLYSGFILQVTAVFWRLHYYDRYNGSGSGCYENTAKNNSRYYYVRIYCYTFV